MRESWDKFMIEITKTKERADSFDGFEKRPSCNGR